jgi:prepilin-type N-terminal cleavage/methylation domain-containing protein
MVNSPRQYDWIPRNNRSVNHQQRSCMICKVRNSAVRSSPSRQGGFSLIELVVVLAIILIMASVAVFNYVGHQRLFKPDEQSSKIIDILQEARQRSLTQRETMRVEIDLTDNVVRLIDESLATTAADDKKIRETVLVSNTDVKINVRPPDISLDPPETLPVPTAQFKTSTYLPSAGHTVCTIRFQRNGTVVNEGTSDIGANATVTGLTLYVWSPSKTNASVSEQARAITVIGTTGSIRQWEWKRSSTLTNKWDDSRRSGAYGG